MAKLELYELKEKLMDLEVDFTPNATRTELEALLERTKVETIEIKEDSVEVWKVKNPGATKLNRFVPPPQDEEFADALKSSEKGTPMAKKKRYVRQVEVIEVPVENKQYIVVGNIKGMAKGSPFKSSESQTKQLLDCGAIEEVKGA